MPESMEVEPLYLDFFKFLCHLKEGDPWSIYQRFYLQPHEKFFQAYWKTFDHFDSTLLAERVRQVKEGDYGLLRSLVQLQDPTLLAAGAVKRSRGVLPLDPVPRVFLFVGFFSADGVTLEVEGRPSIVLGLERFKDFKDLPFLVSHEYGHCAQRLLLKNFFPPDKPTLYFKLVAEGLSVLFSELVYPEVPLHRRLFLTPERFRWCRENQDTLLELAAADLALEKLVPIFFGPGDPKAGLPPRVGYFVGRQMLLHCLGHHGAEDFGKTFPGFEEVFRKILQSTAKEILG